MNDRWKAVLEACKNLAVFQTLVAEHQLTGREIAEGMKLINANEQALETGGARV